MALPATAPAPGDWSAERKGASLQLFFRGQTVHMVLIITELQLKCYIYPRKKHICNMKSLILWLEQIIHLFGYTDV
jgi:hypothetical protein